MPEQDEDTSLTEREMQIGQAAAKLTADDFTAGDLPSVDKLNLHLVEAGHEKTSSAERDAAWARILAVQQEIVDTAPIEPPTAAPEGSTVITITKAMSNPVVVYVAGRALCSIPIGKRTTVPVEALIALRESDAEFTEE